MWAPLSPLYTPTEEAGYPGSTKRGPLLTNQRGGIASHARGCMDIDV